MKLEDLRGNTWLLTERRLARGARPEVKDIARLLRLGLEVSPTVQAHIADILEKKLRNGRPKKLGDDELIRFYLRVERFRQWIKFDGEVVDGKTIVQRAFKMATQSDNISEDTAKKYYYRGKVLFQAL